MDIAQIARHGRLAGSAVAIIGLLAAPAVAFGAMGFGGFHGGGFHGGFHGGFAGGFHGMPVHAPPPPAIGLPPLKPPHFTAPPPIPVRAGFVRVRPSDFFHLHDGLHRKDRFDRRDNQGLPWGWGGWGGYGTYAVGGAYPVYAAQTAPAAEAAPPPCAELLTWSPRLHRAIRRSLCDEAPGGLALAQASVPRG